MSQSPGPDRSVPNYQSPPSAGDAVSTIIPYKNGFALASYYLGVFSIIPCIGLALGIAALIFGILGLKAAKRNPQAKGKAHAIVGIVLGTIFGLLWIAVAVIFVILMATAPMAPPRP